MNSLEMFERAKKVIPGGVNSPVRAFRSVGMTPRFIRSAKGSRIFDVDGREYIDYVGSWGPMILGHGDERISEAVSNSLKGGMSFGAPTENEIVLAEMICDAIDSMEMVRMTTSGTEAVMSAVRVARGFTGRDYILKFEGCYHGHSDGMLVKAGSGALTEGVPDSAGVPAACASKTITGTYNDIDGLAGIFESYGDKLAAVIVEPIGGNMGVVPPNTGFLHSIRRLCDEHGALLIFDEVITGFRIGYGGAQAHYGVRADITTLGKIIGGGMPVGAYGGRRDIMEMISPLGPVYQAGTLSGSPVATAAGIATLSALKSDPGIYARIEGKARFLESSFLGSARKHGVDMTVNREGGMISAFFTDEIVEDFRTAVTSDTERFARYFRSMLEGGVYIAPSQFEAIFLSDAHTDDDLEFTSKAIDEAIRSAR